MGDLIFAIIGGILGAPISVAILYCWIDKMGEFTGISFISNNLIAITGAILVLEIVIPCLIAIIKHELDIAFEIMETVFAFPIFLLVMHFGITTFLEWVGDSTGYALISENSGILAVVIIGIMAILLIVYTIFWEPEAID